MDKVVNVVLTEDILDKLDTSKDVNGFRSRSNYIRILLDACLSQIDAKGFHGYLQECGNLAREKDKSREHQQLPL